MNPESFTPAHFQWAFVDGVATITLQRPGLTSALRRDLRAVLEAVADDEAVRAVLVTGSGRAFCVGQDLGEHVEKLRSNAASSLSFTGQYARPRGPPCRPAPVNFAPHPHGLDADAVSPGPSCSRSAPCSAPR